MLFKKRNVTSGLSQRSRFGLPRPVDGLQTYLYPGQRRPLPKATPFLSTYINTKDFFFLVGGTCLSLANCWFSLSPRLWHFLSHHFSHQQFLITKIISPTVFSKMWEGCGNPPRICLPSEAVVLGNGWPATIALLVLSSRGTGFPSHGTVYDSRLFHWPRYFQAGLLMQPH